MALGTSEILLAGLGDVGEVAQCLVDIRDLADSLGDAGLRDVAEGDVRYIAGGLGDIRDVAEGLGDD